MMREKGLEIREMEGDGNCLFRAVADQVYRGEQDYHALVREYCMQYIELEREFFSQFIVGGDSMFETYLACKRELGVWGDDIELQALSEIYNRPIEIYAYNTEPMRTFHEDLASNQQND